VRTGQVEVVLVLQDMFQQVDVIHNDFMLGGISEVIGSVERRLTDLDANGIHRPIKEIEFDGACVLPGSIFRFG
jgi:hypothetical protein